MLALISRQDEQKLNYELLSDLRQMHNNESTNSIATNGLLIFDGSVTSEMQTEEKMVS